MMGLDEGGGRRREGVGRTGDKQWLWACHGRRNRVWLSELRIMLKRRKQPGSSLWALFSVKSNYSLICM